MGDDLFPRLKLHNAFGHEAVRSAVEAIDDALYDLIGERGDESLRAEIEKRIVAAWNGHHQWMEDSFKAGRLIQKPADPFHLRAAAEISNAILESTWHDVTNDIGVPIANEVLRALMNLTEGAMNINRDAIMQLGFDPDSLKPLDGK
jgi:hypothetical protein